MTYSLAFLNNLMGMDGLVVLVIGLLIFGRRLPEVGRNLGRTFTQVRTEDWQAFVMGLMIMLTIAVLLLLYGWWSGISF